MRNEYLKWLLDWRGHGKAAGSVGGFVAFGTTFAVMVYATTVWPTWLGVVLGLAQGGSVIFACGSRYYRGKAEVYRERLEEEE